jgi:hypothetical protein
MFRRFLKRIFTPPFVVLAALFMFVEEWIWDRMAALMARVARLPIMQRLEQKLRQLPPYGALALLLIPGLLLLPVKLAALYFIAHGHAMAGLMVIITAKIVGTALVARLFAVCHETLMTINWLSRLTAWVVRIKTSLYDRIKSMAAWKRMVELKHSIAHFFRGLRKDGLGRRWKAVKRLLKRQREAVEPPVQPETPKPE